MDFIKAKGLTRVFYQGTDAEVHALKGVDISIDKGEMLSIIGRSGSGKSTLMHILGCVDRPDEGEYCFCGRSVNTLSERELAVTRNQKIGFVLQEFGLILSKTSLENVSLPLYFNPHIKYRDIHNMAMQALEQVGIAGKAKCLTAELSGGQKQRVAIARAIVNRPELLLADEPTGALDRQTADEIMDLFHHLHDTGITIVIVTHDTSIACQCQRMVTLSDGRIVY